jgi:hypothetical protein
MALHTAREKMTRLGVADILMLTSLGVATLAFAFLSNADEGGIVHASILRFGTNNVAGVVGGAAFAAAWFARGQQTALSKRQLGEHLVDPRFQQVAAVLNEEVYDGAAYGFLNQQRRLNGYTIGMLVVAGLWCQLTLFVGDRLMMAAIALSLCVGAGLLMATTLWVHHMAEAQLTEIAIRQNQSKAAAPQTTPAAAN